MEVVMVLTPLQDDLGFLLSRASGLVVRATNATLLARGLRHRQWSVLVLAADTEGGITQRELAGVLGLDPSQVVLLVDELAAAGLVERHASTSDRRTKLVAATADGARVRAESAPELTAATEHQLGRLSAAERDQLRDLLSRITPS